MVEKIINNMTELSAFARVSEEPALPGSLVGLSGDLGAGKTPSSAACVEAVAASQGITPPRVISPSFVLHQSYAQLRPPIEHFDLYRLDHIDDETLMNLGYWERVEFCRLNQGFLFVEWPEHSKSPTLLGLNETWVVSIRADQSRVFTLTP